jgi:exosortase A
VNTTRAKSLSQQVQHTVQQFAQQARSPRLWPGVLAVVALLFLFRDTVAEMMATYDRSGTFAHAYLVPPIVVWLIWRLRHVLAPLPVKPLPVALLAVFAAGAVWLAGELAVVNAASQLALVTLLILVVPVVYGWAIARAMTFPLLFLYFAAPVGTFLAPVMMEATADFTVMALRWTGIPVYREGLQFVIPSGNWSVVEACSGVRYLIASFMVGTLFAYLNYTSTKRRLLFVVMSLLVPVVANWLRAYMIVMLGHYSGNKLAVGVDHLIYGWVFFGLVIGLMFMVGARWSQPNPALDGVPGAAPGPAPGPTPVASAGQPVLHATTTALRPSWAGAAGLLAVAVAVQAVLWQLDRPRADPLAPVQLPSTLAGWQVREQPLSAWVPAYFGARAVAQQVYLPQAGTNTHTGSSNAPTQPVAVWLGYYREQGRQNKLVSSSNSLSRVEETQWAQVSRSSRKLQVAGQTVPLSTALLRGPGEPGSASAQRLVVWHTYWIGGQWVTSDARAKLMLALNRLLGRGDDSAVLFFYTPLIEDGNDMARAVAKAEATLQSLVGEQLPQFEARLRAAAKMVDPAIPAATPQPR